MKILIPVKCERIVGNFRDEIKFLLKAYADKLTYHERKAIKNHIFYLKMKEKEVFV